MAKYAQQHINTNKQPDSKGAGRNIKEKDSERDMLPLASHSSPTFAMECVFLSKRTSSLGPHRHPVPLARAKDATV